MFAEVQSAKGARASFLSLQSPFCKPPVFPASKAKMSTRAERLAEFEKIADPASESMVEVLCEDQHRHVLAAVSVPQHARGL